MQTITVEIRVDFQDEEKYKVMLEATRATARELLTTALMLKDKREPQISLQSGDMFERNKELEIMSPEVGE